MPKPSTFNSNGPSKGRGAVTPYNLFVRTCREELRRKYPQLNVDYSVIARKCSERWKGMTEQEKKRFYDTAELQKKRYHEEIVPSTGPTGFLLESTPSTLPMMKKPLKKKERKVKDPHAPKKPLSAYFLFCADERPKLLNSQTGMSVSEAARELGARWKTVPAEIKSRYEQMAMEQKDVYRNEMAHYKSQTSSASEDYSNSLASFLTDHDANYSSSFDLSDGTHEFDMIHSEHQM